MIYRLNEADALEKITTKNMTVGVVGVGTIGLPVATFFAKAGFRVIGFDVNLGRVEKINNRSVYFEYSNLLKEIDKTRLEATTDMTRLKEADTIIVCVPTPVDEKKNMILDFVLSAGRNIGSYAKPGTLIILESSVSIGTSRLFGAEIEKFSGRKIGKDFGLGYCPERYNPTLPQEVVPHVIYGKEQNPSQTYTFDTTPRVIGGYDEKSTRLAKALYESVINAEIKPLSSIEASEATKLLENIFRDVNIALINEMAKIFSALNIDVYEVINAAKTKPFAFLPHYPGPGVGGECIPVDTWYLIKQAEEKNITPELMLCTRKINDSMPSYVVDLVKDALNEAGKTIGGSKVCILGVSYKKNINDTRLTPAEPIIRILSDLGADVYACDPFATKLFAKHVDIVNVGCGMDCIVMVTDHDVFKTLDMNALRKGMNTPVIVDTRNFFDEVKLKNLGFVYRGVGKPAIK